PTNDDDSLDRFSVLGSAVLGSRFVGTRRSELGEMMRKRLQQERAGSMDEKVIARQHAHGEGLLCLALPSGQLISTYQGIPQATEDSGRAIEWFRCHVAVGFVHGNVCAQ